METKPIETELGIIQYRDTIFLKEVETSIYPFTLKLSGKIAGKHCSNVMTNRDIPFDLYFDSVKMFNCFQLDYSPVDRYTKSCLDEVINSDLLQRMQLTDSQKHYIVSTYDYVFEIIAKTFDLKLN